MISYIVTMYKYGQREGHHYILGAWETLETAIKIGDDEVNYRGPGLSIDNNKYEFEVLEFDTNQYRLEKLLNADSEDRPNYIGTIVRKLLEPTIRFSEDSKE